MAAQFVSIDVGSYSTKVILAAENGAGIAVNGEFSFRTPAGAVSGGELADEKLLFGELSAVIKANRLEGRRAVVSMQSMEVINREYTLPYVKDREIESMLRYEIAQFMPAKIDDCVLQYKVLGSFMDGPRKMLSVAAALVPKTLTDKYYRLLVEVKLKPAALDIHFNSLGKFHSKLISAKPKKIATEESQEPIADSKLFMDLGHENIAINIMKNDITKITRMLPGGGADLISALKSDLAISDEEALRKLHNLHNLTVTDLVGAEARSIEAVRNVIAGWARQIGNTMEFYSAREHSRINELILYGGLSNIPGIDVFFEEQLAIPVSDLRHLSVVSLKSSINAACLINALGALIRIGR